jgi:hypothetical protein
MRLLKIVFTCYFPSLTIVCVSNNHPSYSPSIMSDYFAAGAIVAALIIAIWQYRSHISELKRGELASQRYALLIDLYKLNNLYLRLAQCATEPLRLAFQKEHNVEFEGTNNSIINNLVRPTIMHPDEIRGIYAAIGSARFPRIIDRVEALQVVIENLERHIKPEIRQIFQELADDNARILPLVRAQYPQRP